MNEPVNNRWFVEMKEVVEWSEKRYEGKKSSFSLASYMKKGVPQQGPKTCVFRRVKPMDDVIHMPMTDGIADSLIQGKIELENMPHSSQLPLIEGETPLSYNEAHEEAMKAWDEQFRRIQPPPLPLSFLAQDGTYCPYVYVDLHDVPDIPIDYEFRARHMIKLLADTVKNCYKPEMNIISTEEDDMDNLKKMHEMMSNMWEENEMDVSEELRELITMYENQLKNVNDNLTNIGGFVEYMKRFCHNYDQARELRFKIDSIKSKIKSKEEE